jgi:hypothetical protein
MYTETSETGTLLGPVFRSMKLKINDYKEESVDFHEHRGRTQLRAQVDSTPARIW